MQSFEIPGRLDGLNEYTGACRANYRVGAAMKRRNQDAVTAAIKAAGIKPVSGKVDVHCIWCEKNMRRDKDNIRFGVKFVLDALVECGIIPNDSWAYINKLSDDFFCSKSNPRVIIEIEEVSDAD